MIDYQRTILRKNLSTLFKPKNLVCVGGSQALGCIKASRRAGFKGKIWAVNPKLRPVDGAISVKSIKDIPVSPDAALIALSAERTLMAVTELAEIGTKGAVSIASGFAEIDKSGEILQKKIKECAGNMALLGPNCMGIINFFDGAAVWGSDNHMNKVEGYGAAFISQSGAFVFNSSNIEIGFPLGYAISTGNQAVIDLSDCIDVVLRDKRVKAIGIYIEGINNAYSLAKACWKALKKGIPIIALKGASNVLSDRAVYSHTGSMVVEDTLWEAFKNRYGIIEVESPKTLIETLKFITVSGIPRGNRLAAVTYSGGLNSLIATQIDSSRLMLPKVPNTAKKKLKAIMPRTVTIANPFDMNFPFSSSSGISMENGEAIAEAIYIFAREMADLVVFFIDIPRKGKLDLDKIWTPSIEHLDILVKKLGVPIAVGATFPEGIEPDLRLMLIKKGIAPLLGLSDVLSALNASIIWKVQSEKLLKNKFQKLLSISENSSFQNVINNEAVSKDTLKTFGLRFPKYKKLNLKGLQRINEKLDCPMVLKICSDEVPHKQLMGGVKTNLLTKNRILNAAKLIAKNYERKFRKEFSGYFLLEENINYNSDEYIIGAKKDPIMGITIIFGRGGTNVESKKDFKALLCPINSNELKLTLEYFGLTVEMNAFKELKQLILAVQTYVRKNIETFETLDLNPVVIDNNHRAVALDALLTTARI